jgi:hypothetical protein
VLVPPAVSNNNNNTACAHELTEDQHKL